ncbi:hypothetical protein [Oceanirhabdus seepicola]|uniref:Uncharacterized protein n=1 Tax=Oceanirhabdus seepicola TaxID=2828781 RepID=A0A9J6P1M2_9CLOT|nr:hypothetical protein [Oceanirhabdus seepicola]MCM1989400.1 hypothetical protein [Oceanirhabdus seepicola]
MNNNVKGKLSIFLMSALCFMMVTTKHHRALGDYVLESIGLKSWSGNYSGDHLTVIYFGVLFFISIFFVEKYAIGKLKLRRWDVFLVFVGCMIIFSAISKTTVRLIKENSAGLLSIGYKYENSSMNYRAEENELVEFTAKFTLTNYSKKKKTFYLSIDSPFDRHDGLGEISFYTFDGKPAVFELQGKETKTFILTLDDYKVLRSTGFYHSGHRGPVREVVLANEKGEKIRIDGRKGFVINLGSK